MDNIYLHSKRFFHDMDMYTVKYIVIGFSGVLIDYIVFNLLFHIAFPIYLANIISSGLGIYNNYYWNSRHNFKKHDNTRMRNFFIVGTVGLGVSTLLMISLSSFNLVPVSILKLAVTFFVVSIQYIINRYVTFK